MEHNKVSKPFLRWAGSKRRLLPKLLEYWATGHKRYIEPFMGSACMFFAASPQTAILGDINPHLVATFIAVRDHPRAVHNAIERIPQGKRSYYRMRSTDTAILSNSASAARFIFLNRFCFNGLYRTNRDGYFNVPFSNSRTGPLPNLADLLRASRTLKTADIRRGDFADMLTDVRSGDFVYLDPPFAVSNRRLFRQYDPQSFGLSDLDRLSKVLQDIDHRGAAFLVSYAVCKEALSRFSKWNVRRLQTQRNIAGFASDRRRAVELVISNISL